MTRSEFQGSLEQYDASIPLSTVSVDQTLFEMDICLNGVEIGYDDQDNCPYYQKGIRPPIDSGLKANGDGHSVEQDDSDPKDNIFCQVLLDV